MKAEERQKQQAAMAAKCSRHTKGQGGIAKKVRIDVNTSTGGCSEAAVKQSSARQSKRSGEPKMHLRPVVQVVVVKRRSILINVRFAFELTMMTFWMELEKTG